MKTRERAPRWWVLYLILPLTAGLFWLDSRTNMTAVDHEGAQIGILALIFVLLLAWLHGETAALLRQSEREEASSGCTYRLVMFEGSPMTDRPGHEWAGVEDEAGLVRPLTEVAAASPGGEALRAEVSDRPVSVCN